MAATVRRKTRISNSASPSVDSAGSSPRSALNGGGARRVSELLLWGIDAGILGTLFVAPYFMGGRHPVGRFVLVVFASVMTLSWALRQCVLPGARWRSTGGQWLLVLAVAVAVLQLVPLPSAIHATLSPDSNALLPLWGEAAGGPGWLGQWTQLSMYPAAAINGLAILLAYGLIFFVTVQRVERLEDVKRLIRWISLAATLMAVVGLLQYLAANGKFLWVYEHPFRSAVDVQGPFINRNHFCHLLALGVGPLCCWLVMSLNSRGASSSGFGRGGTQNASAAKIGVGFSLAVVVFTGLLTASRGGVLVMALAMGVIACLYLRGSLIGRRWLVGLLALIVLMGASLAIHGVDQLSTRLGTLTTLSLDEVDNTRGRRKIWEANAASVASSPWVGRGIGSHLEYNEIFLGESLPYEYTHAENGPLQIAGETGVVGVALLLLALATVGGWCWTGLRQAQSPSELACAGAIAVSLLVSVVHSAVDFVWYIPACMSWTMILCALSCRVCQLTKSRDGAGCSFSFEIPRIAWVGAGAGVVVLSFFMLQVMEGPAWGARGWDQYLRCSRRLEGLSEESLAQAGAGGVGAASRSDEERGWYLQEMASGLRQCVASDPANARAHLRLASVYLQLFQREQQGSENAMELVHIREAAIASKFESRQSLDEWLGRAIGSHRLLLDHARWHARRAVRLCPLQGEGYSYLADLCFLGGGGMEDNTALIEQALKVRPSGEEVLFAAGRAAMIRGDLETAITCWRRCYHAGGTYRGRLMKLLAGQVPIDFFLSVFEPSFGDWRTVYRLYSPFFKEGDVDGFREYFVAKGLRGLDELRDGAAISRWASIRSIHVVTGDLQGAISYGEQAYALFPRSSRVRRALGVDLLKAGRYSEAEGHLLWCRRLASADAELDRLVRRATVGRVRGDLK